MNSETKIITVEKKSRSSNFELLRIISIILIIAYHYCIHGNHHEIFKSDISLNQIFSIIFGSWGLLGVDCFIFISAYFLLDSKNFHTKKLLKLITETIFYSVGMAVLLKFTSDVKIGRKELIDAILSPINSIYWFVTAYCLLYVIYPFLNSIINSMASKHLSKFLITLTLLIPIYRTVLSDAPIDDFLFFIYLYLLMGYLKKNPGNWFEVHAKAGFLITSIGIIFYNIILSSLGTGLHSQALEHHAFQFATRYSPVIVLDSIFLFYIFKNINVKTSKLINTLASTTLGVYLFHENPLLKKVLWDDILKIENVYYSDLYLVYFILSVILLYVLGVILDLLRIKLLEKPFFSIRVNRFETLLSKIDSWVSISSHSSVQNES